jgi:hypothetical protein
VSREIKVEILVQKNATVCFFLCCHDLLKPTVGIWRACWSGMRRMVFLSLVVFPIVAIIVVKQISR